MWFGLACMGEPDAGCVCAAAGGVPAMCLSVIGREAYVVVVGGAVLSERGRGELMLATLGARAAVAAAAAGVRALVGCWCEASPWMLDCAGCADKY